jgi:uncharacterized membrane protein YoaK (UPF0700 family)
MPLFYLRRLTGTKRTASANFHLACYLAFAAGAVNAGGFLAVRQYTSHMSGLVSAMGYNLALGRLPLVFAGLAGVMSFFAGAVVSALLNLWARARALESEYALPLIAEALLLILFGAVGHEFTGGRALGTVMLLCFTMGLQNAIITNLSGSVIRTTHVTGMVTDIGIAAGKLIRARTGDASLAVAHEWKTFRLLASLVALFFTGGVTGALGFKHAGFLFTLPIAAGLLLLAAMPVVDDLQRRRMAAVSRTSA